ncbi:MAG: insulinase family protein [Candidatus Marinimicrobia bacterium]|nr:insulinase family protein [Candidatus Neomarinimicrobiota bacterium]MCF7840480.1 insulinase family protein [Candidatus Neomarinimicrobiota bacterium]
MRWHVRFPRSVMIPAALVVLNACGTVPELVLSPSDESNLIDIRLNFKVGSAADPENQPGLARLTLWTIMHGGTKDLTQEEITYLKYPLAAAENLFIDRDNLVISATVHGEKFDDYYPLLRDRLLRPRWDKKDFEHQKKQLAATIENSLMGENDEWFGKEMLQWLLYPQGHPYHWPTVGRVEAVENLTIKDVEAFWENHLGTGNLVIGLAGPHTPKQRKQIEKDFSGFHFKSYEPTPLPAPVELSAQAVVLVEKPTDAAAISMGFPLDVSPADPDYYALLLFNACFGQHRTFVGRLMNEMRVKRGLNYGDYSYINHFVQNSYSPYPRPGVFRRQQYFSIWIRPVKRENAHFAIRQAIWELNDVVEHGIPEEKFQHAKEFIVHYAKLWAASQTSQLGFLVDSHLAGIPYYIDQIESMASSLTREQVNAAVQRHLTPENLQIAVICKDAPELAEALRTNKPSPIHYDNPVSPDILEKDQEIMNYPLNISGIEILAYQETFK